jgi:dihydropteroate synthase
VDAGAAGASDGCWKHRSGALDLSTPVIMGVLNVTPDSFSDGGLHFDLSDAGARAV